VWTLRFWFASKGREDWALSNDLLHYQGYTLPQPKDSLAWHTLLESHTILSKEGHANNG
jgi:hypothetical protein